MKNSACLLIAILFSSTVLATRPGSVWPQQSGETFSFENDLEGWTPDGIDLELGDSLINWSVTRSQESAADGAISLKFYLENFNDAGKIWIERPFTAEPGQTYQVGVVRLGPGDTYSVRQLRPHLVANDGDSSATFLVLQGIGEYDYIPLV